MAVPKRKRQSGATGSQKRRALVLTLSAIAAVSWTSIIFLSARSFLIKKDDAAHIKAALEKHDPVHEIDVWPDDLQHAGFQKTIKSCLPNENPKCLKYIPEGTTTERIAVLRPPGALGYLFESFVQEVVRLHKTSTADMELIPTSHVPPYGYGKTHGYTKLIRLATMPLRLAATDMVLQQVTDSSRTVFFDDITLQDIKEAVRQIVRWHCRLSHVAAHTSILTITLEDLIEEPWEEEYKVREFLGLKGEHRDLKHHMMDEKHVDEDEMIGSLDQIVKHAEKLLMRINRLESPNNNVEDVLDRVIDEELSTTNNLHDWPCLSFWSVAEHGRANITTISKANAKGLSPQCSAQFTKCFVARDKCEDQGDAICRGNKRRQR